MLKHLPRVRVATSLLCMSLVIGAQLAHASEIKPVMKDMKRAMQGALASSTMPELSGYVVRLESDADRASDQPYRSDQATYDEGMRTLKEELAAVDQAVHANDMDGAKQALRKINSTRKHYHDLLN